MTRGANGVLDGMLPDPCSVVLSRFARIIGVAWSNIEAAAPQHPRCIMLIPADPVLYLSERAWILNA